MNRVHPTKTRPINLPKIKKIVTIMGKLPIFPRGDVDVDNEPMIN